MCVQQEGGRAIYRPSTPEPYRYFGAAGRASNTDGDDGEVLLTTFR